MPLIEVKAFDERFQDEERSQLLIERLTEALASVYGEQAGEETQVLLHGVSRAHWGFGGTRRL